MVIHSVRWGGVGTVFFRWGVGGGWDFRVELLMYSMLTAMLILFVSPGLNARACLGYRYGTSDREERETLLSAKP